MSTLEDTKEEIYKVHEIPLNAILTEKVIELDTPLLYILNTPITVQARLNNEGSDLFTLNRLSLIKASEGKKITRLYLTTTETSTDTLDVMATDKEILGDIGVKSTVTLTTTLGVEYDARLRKSTNDILDVAEIRNTSEFVGTLLDISDYDKIVILMKNTLDQAVTIQFEASTDNSTFFDIGSLHLLGALTGKDVATLTDGWKYVRAKHICSISPTTGISVTKYNMK